MAEFSLSEVSDVNIGKSRALELRDLRYSPKMGTARHVLDAVVKSGRSGGTIPMPRNL